MKPRAFIIIHTAQYSQVLNSKPEHTQCVSMYSSNWGMALARLGE